MPDRRAFVKVDKYAPFDLAREHRLTGHALELLLGLTLLTDWRTSEWRGTCGELAELLRISRNTIPKAVEDLRAAGLLAIIKPFGRNSEGCLSLTAYDELVVPEKRRSPQLARHQVAQSCATSWGESDEPDTSDRGAVTSDPHPIRQEIAQTGATHLGKQGARRTRGSEEVICRESGASSNPASQANSGAVAAPMSCLVDQCPGRLHADGYCHLCEPF